MFKNLKPLFSNKNLMKLWISDTISTSGDYIFLVAVVWLAWVLYASPFVIGIIFAARTVPIIVVSPYTGSLSDKYNKKFMIILGNLAQGIVLLFFLIFYLIGLLSIVSFVLFIVLLYSFKPFVDIPESAILPELVKKEQIKQSNALFSTTSASNRIIGMGIGGVIIGLFGFSIPISYDFVTFILALIIMSAVKYKPVNATTNGMIKPDGTYEMREKINFKVLKTPFLSIIIIALFFNIIASGFNPLVAPFVSKLGGDSIIYGWLLGIMALGALLVSIFMSSRRLAYNTSKSNRHEFSYSLSLLFFSLLIMSLFSNTVVFFPIFFILGASETLFNVNFQTLIQTNTPAEKLGRMFGMITAILRGLQPISALSFAYIATEFGIKSSILVLTVIALAVLISHSMIHIKESNK